MHRLPPDAVLDHAPLDRVPRGVEQLRGLDDRAALPQSPLDQHALGRVQVEVLDDKPGGGDELRIEMTLPLKADRRRARAWPLDAVFDDPAFDRVAGDAEQASAFNDRAARDQGELDQSALGIGERKGGQVDLHGGHIVDPFFRASSAN